MNKPDFNTIIIGAGAAGLHCAAYTKRAGSTLIIDHAKKPGEKIRISGGGRCNFTNLNCTPENFISANPHFIKSALARYSQWDFIDLIAQHGTAYHEKTLGQLFCDGSAQAVIQMLLDEMDGAEMRLETSVTAVAKTKTGFLVTLEDGQNISCSYLVISTGGKSIPKMGATGFGYQIAREFDLPIVEPRPGLVPLTFSEADLNFLKPLAGVALPTRISCGGTSFPEAMLFTHRGLSGPAILQISSYWREGDTIEIDLCPGVDAYETLRRARAANGKLSMGTVLAEFLPKRLATALCDQWRADGQYCGSI